MPELTQTKHNETDLYLNIPQMRVLLTDPKEVYLHYGRRLGKSTEIISHLSYNRIHDMPRAGFLMMGRTYKQVLTRTLPGTIKGWEKRGFVENVHFVIGKRPPDDWPRTFNRPTADFSHFISTYTGAGFHIGSQDRAGLVNSLTVWGIFGDESKLLLEDRFKEDAMPTNSGETHIFKDSPHCRTVVLTSSMPSLPDGKWLFDMEKKMDRKQIEDILKLSVYHEELKARFNDPKMEYYRKRILQKMGRVQKALLKRRQNSVLYDEASTIANVHILGTDYIRQQKTILKNFFKPEILSIKAEANESGFYSQLSRANFYTDFDYSHYDKYSFRNVVVNSMGDRDCVKTMPLIIGMDFGPKFNNIVTAQRFDSVNTIKFLNVHWVGKEKIVDDVVKKWCDYYEFHPIKDVRFHHDKTGNNRTGLDKDTYAQRVMKILRSRGWNVTQKTIGGSNPRHQAKYLLWNLSLPYNDLKYPRIQINAENCEQLKISMDNAGVIDKDGMISKDKSSERKESIPPQDATHISDAADSILLGEYEHLLNDNMVKYSGIVVNRK